MISFLILLFFTTIPSLSGFTQVPKKTFKKHLSVPSNTLTQKLYEKEQKPCKTILKASSTTQTSSQNKELDKEALTKYLTSLVVQVSLLTTSLYMLDLGQDPARNMSPFPLPVVFFIFYACSLRSRIFSLLNNQRPNLKEASAGKATQGFGDRVMPRWTPPGVVFPIMWILIISPLRAYSSLLVFESFDNHFFSAPLIALILHLSIGDTWNTINNVERRIGASVVGVLCVWASAVFASYQYFQVDEFAGKLLGATCIWLTVASALITDTWRINTMNDGKRDVLYPVKTDNIQTKFFFEES